MLITEFRALVLDNLKSQMPDKAAAIDALQSDDDLLGSGILDSYSLINLCLAVEAWTGATIDIGVLEPEQFGSIEALLKLVNAANDDGGGEARMAALCLVN
jgi:acyl carrier protein